MSGALPPGEGSKPPPEDPLGNVDPGEVQAGLDKEELALKNIKNVLMEELERVQLEEMLLRRQLDAAKGGAAAPSRPPAASSSAPAVEAHASLKDLLDE